MKKNIIIGTTSINRPILHSDIITDWYNWINNVDKNIYNIDWFINIDYIETLNSSIKETRDNYKNIIKDINTHFLDSCEKKGNFLNACKKISTNIEKYVEDNKLNKDNVIIIWLEDDWKLRNNNISLNELINLYLSNLTYINLTFIRLNYIHALAPSIISYNLWSQIHLVAWKNQKNNIDPEHCAGLYFINNFYKYKLINNITIIRKNINENYLNNDFINYKNSYFSYDKNVINKYYTEKYIKVTEIPDFCKDKITFIRMTGSFCPDGVNYGRHFMEKYNLKKKMIQDDNNIDFYN